MDQRYEKTLVILAKNFLASLVWMVSRRLNGRPIAINEFVKYDSQ